MILFVFASIYFLTLAGFVVGLMKGLRNRGVSHGSDASPRVSVIVCARNEEIHIGRCIESLSKLSYPEQSIEFIVVDDHSDDSTPEILAKWQHTLPNLKIVNTDGKENCGGGGKVNALIHGIDAATGEYVFITDADCEVSPQWINNYLKWYDDRTGMVSSITILNSSRPFDAAQSTEMMQLLGMSMAAINIGIPVSIIGNNLSIRKKAYEAIGGYRKIPFSVTEDVELFRAMWRSEWDVKFKANDDLLVKTNPPVSVRQWGHQKQRWVVGGAKSIGPSGWMILLLGYLGWATMIAAPFLLSPINVLFIIIIKLLGDLLIVLPVMRSMKTTYLLPYFPVYQVYLLFFLLCVPFKYAQKTVVWKGRDYQT